VAVVPGGSVELSVKTEVLLAGHVRDMGEEQRVPAPAGGARRRLAQWDLPNHGEDGEDERDWGPAAWPWAGTAAYRERLVSIR
jgi:hypothetical protein